MKLKATTENLQTPEEIKAFYSDRYNYFTLCRQVAFAIEADRAGAVWYLKNVMLVLGYPEELKSWSVDKAVTYAQNIVCMG
jgi:hypothetical protein